MAFVAVVLEEATEPAVNETLELAYSFEGALEGCIQGGAIGHSKGIPRERLHPRVNPRVICVRIETSGRRGNRTCISRVRTAQGYPSPHNKQTSSRYSVM